MHAAGRPEAQHSGTRGLGTLPALGGVRKLGFSLIPLGGSRQHPTSAAVFVVYDSE